MSLRATCPDCSKSYRVPHDRKEWRCKACDAAMEIDDQGSRADGVADPGGVACDACGALNVGDAAFCGECGAPLVEDAPQRSGLTRKEAAGEMRRAMLRISRIKSWLGLNLVLGILSTGALALLLFRSEGLSGGEIAILCALQAVLLGLSYAAYRHVDRKPLPIVTAVASLQTLNAIWSYLDGATWIPAFVWALLLWWLVTDAAHVARLAAEHPHLYSARRRRGEHLTHEQGGGRRGTESVRERVAGRGSAGTNWWVLGGVVTVALILGVAALRATKSQAPRGGFIGPGAHPSIPSPFAATEAFRAAWNAHDVDALGRLTKESLREKMTASLEDFGERYEWGAEFPQLEPAVFVEPQRGNVQVIFPSEAGEFPVRFVVENGEWVVRSLKTSPLADWRPR